MESAVPSQAVMEKVAAAFKDSITIATTNFELLLDLNSKSVTSIRDYADFHQKVICMQSILRVYIDMHACIYTRIHIHTFKHTYMHTYMHTHIHIHIHIYIHTYIHTYIHIYVRTYIRIQ